MPEISVDLTTLNTYQKRIGQTGILLYIRLASLVDDQRQVTIAARKLAEMMDLSTDTIRRYLSKMEKAGVIRITQNLDELGRNNPYTYTLLV